MIDHFKKSKNSIDRLIKIEKSIDRSIHLKKLIHRSQNIYQAQAIKKLKKNRTSFFYILFISETFLFSCGFWQCMLLLGIFISKNNRKKSKKNWKKSIIRSFQIWVIENRWSKFHDRKKKSIVFLPINQKRSIIDFWSESVLTVVNIPSQHVELINLIYNSLL